MGGPKNRSHSRITDDLPEEVRVLVDRLLIEGSATYDDIKVFLDSKGYDISRSAIGRYGKGYLNFYRRVRVAMDQAKTLASDQGEGMVLEEAISKGFSQQLVEMLVSGDINLRDNTRILADFAKLQTSSALRERMKKEVGKKAEKAADDAARIARAGGLTDAKAAEIRKKILGIAA